MIKQFFSVCILLLSITNLSGCSMSSDAANTQPLSKHEQISKKIQKDMEHPDAGYYRQNPKKCNKKYSPNTLQINVQ